MSISHKPSAVLKTRSTVLATMILVYWFLGRRISLGSSTQLSSVGESRLRLPSILAAASSLRPLSFSPVSTRNRAELIVRFEKRIYIPLPDVHARRRMFELNVGTTPHGLTPQDFQQLAELTDGYVPLTCYLYRLKLISQVLWK